MVPISPDAETEVKHDVVEEAYEVLQALGHSAADARKLLDGVLTSKKKFKDVQALLEAVYKQTHEGSA